MTDEDQKRYIRRLNAGALPWEIEPTAPPGAEHPIFSQEESPVSHGHNGSRVQPLPEDFAPDEVYVEFLELHHGIPVDFTQAQLPEFKLYWLETGEARKAWQNKFKNHVIYQWKRRQSEAGQRSHRTTAEKLTDTSWADDDWFDQLDS